MPVSASMALEESSPSSSSGSRSPSVLPSQSSSISRSPSRLSSPSRSRSRSRSWSPQSQRRARSRSPVDSTEARSSEAQVAKNEGAAAGDAKLLYLFFYYLDGPIAYCLYRVDVPILVPISSKEKASCDQMKEQNTSTIINPILEFCSREYPTGMCCVELDSKLYFLGGMFDPDPTDIQKRKMRNYYEFIAACPPDVYVLDSSSEVLKKGTRMNTGKPHPYVFVAYRKIYAIVGFVRWGYDKNDLSRFEVFDPDTNQWSILPDPPMNAVFTGHAVVDRKVFLVTRDNKFFYFNVDKCDKWVSFLKYYRHFPLFDRRAEFVEDTLYACYYDTLVAFGPTSKTEPEERAKELFDHMALLSPEMDDAIQDHIPTPQPSTCLVHLGNRIFCHVFTGTIPDPTNTKSYFFTDSERLDISLTFFEALKDNYKENTGHGEKTFFRTNLMRSVHFVATTRCGAHADTAFLCDSFSVPLVKEKESKIKL